MRITVLKNIYIAKKKEKPFSTSYIIIISQLLPTEVIVIFSYVQFFGSHATVIKYIDRFRMLSYYDSIATLHFDAHRRAVPPKNTISTSYKQSNLDCRFSGKYYIWWKIILHPPPIHLLFLLFVAFYWKPNAWQIMWTCAIGCNSGESKAKLYCIVAKSVSESILFVHIRLMYFNRQNVLSILLQSLIRKGYILESFYMSYFLGLWGIPWVLIALRRYILSWLLVGVFGSYAKRTHCHTQPGYNFDIGNFSISSMQFPYLWSRAFNKFYDTCEIWATLQNYRNRRANLANSFS